MDNVIDIPTTKSFKRSRKSWLWVLVLPVLLVIFFSGAKNWLSHSLHEESRRTLGLYVSGLKELLGKFQPLPQIYALHPDIQALLKDTDNSALRHQVNALLEQVNKTSNAADTYVLDSTGMTIAASNWNKPVTFVGRSFNYRPYYTDAMTTGSGRFFALGTTSKQRGYYMSSAVTDAKGTPIGVVVVKIDVAVAEQGWATPSHEVIVTDEAGIVFLSSRPEWLYNAITEPSPETLIQLGETRRYAEQKIGRLPFTLEPANAPWNNTLRPKNGNGPSFLAANDDYIDAGWRVWILANTKPMFNIALVYAGAAVLVIALSAIAVVSLIERRRSLLRALSVQQHARKTLENSAVELERQVEKRTADLKRTQNELVQAGKMAALGQMSVGINHELNQPLTAIRSYASNASKLLAYGRTDEAQENMSLISALSERMGDIILRLKIFARDTSDELTPQVLQTIISDTMRIVEPRLKKEKVKLDISAPEGDIVVLGNNVRMEQVLVNLINNAIDAFESGDEKHIDLSAKTVGQEAIVQVRDTGPGIPNEIINQLFEPFTTTKDVGLGLGLGLSISHGIVHDMGGELNACNLDDGGAQFTVTIPLAPTSAPDSETQT